MPKRSVIKIIIESEGDQLLAKTSASTVFIDFKQQPVQQPTDKNQQMRCHHLIGIPLPGTGNHGRKKPVSA